MPALTLHGHHGISTTRTVDRTLRKGTRMTNDPAPIAPEPAAEPAPTSPAPRVSVFRSWVSLAGLILAMGSFFAFLLLFLLDTLAKFGNPYMGVVIYLVTPAFLVLGLAVAGIGALMQRRAIMRSVPGARPLMQIDLARPRHRRILGAFVGGGLLLLLFTAFATYHAYHFTESVQFCGQTCHGVMQPELTTYHHSAHARVDCVACHIGAGATWYVRSKLSGTYQVYAVLANKYPRPIPTPVRNLRPAQETCEQCHWPKAFVGNVDRTYPHFMFDSSNTPYTVRLLLKVGGGDPTHGPVGGIHWHMNVGSKVEYVAADPERQKIPWVRITDSQSVVTEYRVPGFTNAPSPDTIRRMDCMDCHNRPAHRFNKPDAAVDLAIALKRIDRELPFIKKNAVAALVKDYPTEAHAMQGIATALASQYPDDQRVRPVIDVVQEIYRQNFFPEMKANWKVYHDNIGHKDWPGCFRCHDGEHKTADGTKSIKANDCSACHVILAQGKGDELDNLSAKGQEFAHPGGDCEDMLCSDCHSGGLPP